MLRARRIGQEQRGERGFVVKHTDHRLFVNANERGALVGGCRGHAHQLPSETFFPKKSARLQHRDDGFFPLWRDHGQRDLARLDIEDGIRRIPLRKENLLIRGRQRRFAAADLCEERLEIKRGEVFGSHRLSPLSILGQLLCREE